MSIRNPAKCEMSAIIRFLLVEGKTFFCSIVTVDEIWVAHYTSETKRQSSQQLHTGSPSAKKFKTSILAKKIMVSVFWDRKGLTFNDFFASGKDNCWSTILWNPTKIKESNSKQMKRYVNKRSVFVAWQRSPTHGQRPQVPFELI